MLKFTEWLSLHEGKAMNLGPSVEQFITTALSKLEEVQQKRLYLKSSTGPVLIYEQKLNTPYGIRLVKLYIIWEEDIEPSYASPGRGEITIPLSWRSPRNDLEKTLYHELTHIFDPKEKIPPERYDSWKKNTQYKKALDSNPSNLSYYYRQQPHEEDADMAAQSRQRLKTNLTLNDLRNLIPANGYENQWKKDPRAWRKYINTLYQGLIAQGQHV